MASKFRYDVSICWSDEDHAFIAEVPELQGCAAFGKKNHLLTMA